MARPINPLLIGRPEIEGMIYYSPTGLEAVLECPRRRYFQKHERKKLTWPDFAKGTHLHRKIEELRLHHLRKRARYKSAEAFANVIANDWQRNVIKEGKIRGDKIVWKDEKQPYIIKAEIKEIGLRAYPLLMKEAETNPPIIFSNLTKKGNIVYRTAYEFEFIYKGRGFSGEIDEIRKENDKIIIRDYKTGKWKFIEDKQGYAFQPTEYEFAVCYLCNTDETFRKILGVTKEEAESWIKEPESMSDNIIFEYYMLDLPREWDDKIKEYVIINKNSGPVIKVERENFHYKELCLNIDGANAMLSDMSDKNYYTPIRGYHCNRCFYQKECENMTKKTDVHLRQITLQEYISKINQTKNYIIPDSIPLKQEIKQAEFDFVRGTKNKKIETKT